MWIAVIWQAPAIMALRVPNSLPYFGRPNVVMPKFDFVSVTEAHLATTLREAEPDEIMIVKYQAPWDLKPHDVGPILEANAVKWHNATFFSAELRRGTATGERIYEQLRLRNFARLPLIDVYCGGERIDTLVLPQGEGGGAGAACPLFTEPERVGMLQRAVNMAVDRIDANTRWRERRRVLLSLRQTRRDLRRLEKYREDGLLGRSWDLFKKADTIMRSGERVYTPKKRADARRKHLRTLLSHTRECNELRDKEQRLARRLKLLSTMVLGDKQRCSADGCEILEDTHTGSFATPSWEATA